MTFSLFFSLSFNCPVVSSGRDLIYLSSTFIYKIRSFQLKRRVWRSQRCNQNPSIEVEQITQWQKEKVQKDKQRSTKHTQKTKNRVTRTTLKTGGVLRCSRRVGSSCSTIDTRRVTLVTNITTDRTPQTKYGKLFFPAVGTNPPRHTVTYQVYTLFINMLFIWLTLRALLICPYGQSASGNIPYMHELVVKERNNNCP